MCRLSVVLAFAVVLTACSLQRTQPPPDLPAFALWGPWAPPLAGHAARQSTWDQTGANSDAIRLEPGGTATLFDTTGPGIIRRIWITTNATGPVGRTLVLRMFWDGTADVNSLPITVTSRGRSRNCWWPMPFSGGARITLTNEGPVTHSAVYCHVDYLASTLRLRQASASTRSTGRRIRRPGRRTT
jgi:hypothetical protein